MATATYRGAPRSVGAEWSEAKSRAPLLAYAALAVAIGVLLGAVSSTNVPTKLLVAGAIAPFLMVLVIARPHLAATLYVVVVYTDLLSLLVQYQGMPPLARFVGLALLCAVLGYRFFIQHERLINDG